MITIIVEIYKIANTKTVYFILNQESLRFTTNFYYNFLTSQMYKHISNINNIWLDRPHHQFILAFQVQVYYTQISEFIIYIRCLLCICDQSIHQVIAMIIQCINVFNVHVKLYIQRIIAIRDGNIVKLSHAIVHQQHKMHPAILYLLIFFQIII